ncbi:MAG: hypothetical protein WD029_01685, partial [Microthrixaceae bacterium]
MSTSPQSAAVLSNASAPAPLTVLLVEDEEAFIDALTVGLGREGFIVEVARDGIEALERFALVQPDL